MLRTTITIPAPELPLVEASLGQCPGLHLVGVDRFSHSYCDLHLDYTTPGDLDQLGCCVERALEQQAGEELT